MSLRRWRPRPDTRSGNGHAAMQPVVQSQDGIPVIDPGINPTPARYPLMISVGCALNNHARQRLNKPDNPVHGDRPSSAGFSMIGWYARGSAPGTGTNPRGPALQSGPRVPDWADCPFGVPATLLWCRFQHDRPVSMRQCLGHPRRPPRTCTSVRCSGPRLGRSPISGPRDLAQVPVLGGSVGIYAAAPRSRGSTRPAAHIANTPIGRGSTRR